MADDAMIDVPLSEEDELFLMANLQPRETGLPMVVYVGPRAGARHDIRLKVSTVHGERIRIGETAIVALRPQPRVLYGELPAADFRLIEAWVALNLALLIDYWDERATTTDLIRGLRPLPA